MRMLAYSFSDDSTASFASEKRRDWRSNGLQNEASKAPQLDNSGGLGLESAKAEPRTWSSPTEAEGAFIEKTASK